MRLVILSLALLLAKPAFGAAPNSKTAADLPPGVLLRYHFIGSAEASKTTNGSTWKSIWAQPATLALREQALQRLMRLWSSSLQGNTTPNPAEFQLLVHPLLQDLFQFESAGELRRAPGSPLQWNLAVRPSPERLHLWETNLAQIQTRWGSKSSPVMAVHKSGAWLQISSGRDHFTDRTDLIRSLARHSGTPSNDWLAVALAVPPSLFGQSDSKLVPNSLWLGITGRGDSLRTEGQIHYHDAQLWKVQRWNLPMRTLRDPLNGFTAVQTDALLACADGFWRRLDLEQRPAQAFFWGRSPVPVETYLAFPVPDAGRAFEKIQRQAVPALNAYLQTNKLAQEIAPLTNTTELRWQGLPIIKPFLRPMAEPGGSFLVAGLFPVSNLGTNLPPTELLGQLTSRTDLVYYDWEITEQRLPQMNGLFQIPSIVLHRLGPKTPKTAQRWLETVRPRLGNTITEVAVESPQDLSIRRRSHLGLSAMELIVLARWIDSPSFPRWNSTEIFDLTTPIVAHPAKVPPRLRNP